MTKKEQLPWFKCYPGLLLGALAGMKPDEGYVYTIVLLRLYEVGGAIEDDSEVIARRTGLTKLRVEKALEALFKKRKLINADGMISNVKAEEILSARDELINSRKMIATNAANSRYKKDEQKQQKQDASSNPKTSIKHADKDLDLDKDSKVVRAGARPSPKRSSVATRIDPKLALSASNLTFGRSRGLTRKEIEFEWDRFVRYYRGLPNDAKNAKSPDWDAVWEGWVLRKAGDLGRDPLIEQEAAAEPFDPRAMGREHWVRHIGLFRENGFWHQDLGPEPGQRGCLAPTDLVNHS